MSLKSRLALAKVALHVRADQADLAFLVPVIEAGVDLLVLGSRDDVDADVEALVTFRRAYGHVPLLLAIDNGDAAERASADVVHIERPGWKLWGSYPKGHEWTLLGRGARDARTVRKPGGDWDYMFVGPLEVTDTDSKVLQEALSEQKPLDAEALPWFALGAFTTATADDFISAGVRRIALTGDALEDGDPAALVRGIRAALDDAWKSDPAGFGYTARAVTL